MTVSPWEAEGSERDPLGGEIATYDPNMFDGALPGLEDFDASRVAIPRTSIVHREAVFLDSLTGERVSELNVIMLGLVTQRILWPKTMGDSDSPLCKSRNGHIGYPLLEPNGPAGLIYPFELTPFSEDTMGTDENGNHTLECAVCPLKEWVGRGKGSTPPACSEQFTFVMTQTDGSGQSLFTVQKTGMAPAKRYISDFFRSKRPMFTTTTKIRLIQQARGGPNGVVYCVPEFTKGEPVSPSMYHELGDLFRSAREFITQPPRNGNDAEGDGSTEAAMTSHTVAVEAATAAPARAVAAPAARPAAARPAVARPPAANPVRSTPPPAPFTPDTDELPF